MSARRVTKVEIERSIPSEIASLIPADVQYFFKRPPLLKEEDPIEYWALVRQFIKHVSAKSSSNGFGSKTLSTLRGRSGVLDVLGRPSSDARQHGPSMRKPCWRRTVRASQSSTPKSLRHKGFWVP